MELPSEKTKNNKNLESIKEKIPDKLSKSKIKIDEIKLKREEYNLEKEANERN